MIKAIIFDIGNVLLKFDYTLAFNALAAHSADTSPALIASLEPLNQELESGVIGRSEFVRRASMAINFSGTEADFIAAWEPIFTENLPMWDLVKQLQGQYPLYLLSNVGEIHCDYIFRTYPSFETFTDGVFSYRAGCLKPTREIYEIAARQFGVEPGETLFLDDLPANIRGGREAGFQTVQYDLTAHESLLNELDGLGVGLQRTL